MTPPTPAWKGLTPEGRERLVSLWLRGTSMRGIAQQYQGLRVETIEAVLRVEMKALVLGARPCRQQATVP